MSIVSRTALLTSVALAACTERPAGEAADADCCSVTVHITVPGDVGDVYLTGNQETLGPWRPDIYLMASDGLERSAQIEVPPGTEFEYKFTLGSWNRQALAPSGTVLPNFSRSGRRLDGSQPRHRRLQGRPGDLHR